MIEFDSRTFSLIVFFVIKLIIGYSTLTSCSLDSEIKKIMDSFISKDLRDNETLNDRVRSAIEHVLLQNKYLETEINRKENLISHRSYQYDKQWADVVNKMKKFLMALPIYKAGALIVAIEKKFEPFQPDHCEHCLQWGHLEIDCTYSKPFFLGGIFKNDEINTMVRTRRNYWLWMLQHHLNHTEISQLSNYLHELYRTSNLTDSWGFNYENYEQFEGKFCHDLGQIRQFMNYQQAFYYNDDDLDGGSSLVEHAEHFLKACDRWIDFFQESVNWNRVAEQTTTSSEIETIMTTPNPLLTDINTLITMFIGENIRLDNEKLFNEVKKAIRYILKQIEAKQFVLSSLERRDQAIRKKYEKIENEHIVTAKKAIMTLSIELWTHKVGETLRSKDGLFSPSSQNLCQECIFNLGLYHPDCNSSELTFNQNDSPAYDLEKRTYYWYWRLWQMPRNYTSSQVEWPPHGKYSLLRLSEYLRKEYDSGNFTKFINQLKPKPESLKQFECVISEAMARIDQYVRYLWPPDEYRYRPLVKDLYLYGVPLYKFTVVLAKGLFYGNKHKVVIDYDELISNSEIGLNVSTTQSDDFAARKILTKKIEKFEQKCKEFSNKYG